ncbi:MAG: homoserine O-acetyltransferase [Planctomycetales bacterium]|nr:homoserine O-acetyltransferase [Planctomycetales bacterium]
MESDAKNSVGIIQTQTVRVVEADAPLRLACGKTLGPIDVAYETYGTLNDQKDNAVLICHALSGNAHVAGCNSPDDRKPGWWDIMVGPGKPIDTSKYFVICSNILGGCSGTTGPSDVNPATGRPYGLEFPIITIEDTVHVQKRLLDKLAVPHLLAVVGGSMGGMQVLQWAVSYPEFMDAALCIASTTRLNAQSIAFDAVGRNAILGDPYFNDGQYHGQTNPARGLSIARMIGHITYLSEESMRFKFGRTLRGSTDYTYDFNSEFSVETYLDYQGQAFVERFDANSYLYITKAMDYFDIVREYGSLRQAFAATRCRFLIASFSSDWLFTPRQSEDIMEALGAEGKDVTYCNIYSSYGHDAFLLEAATLGRLIAGFIDSTWHRVRTAQRVRGEKEKTAAGIKPKLPDHAKRVRVDYELIDSLIEPNSRVLDLGCGDGELLMRLVQDKNVCGEGVELDEDLVIHCVQRGLSVIHRDIERGLEMYPNETFDYAVLSQTIQTLRDPQRVLLELHRVARRVIVSFPNFAHWRCRAQLMFKGIAPQTRQLPFRWYNSPNIHFLSLKDYDHFCAELDIHIEQKIPLGKISTLPLRILPNFFAPQAIYVTSKYHAS